MPPPGSTMAIDVSRWWEQASAWRSGRALRLRAVRLLKKFFGQYRFNSITRRIIVINFFGVAILVFGIFYLNQYRFKFIETRVESLTTQAAIIATAISEMSRNTADQSSDSSQVAGENKIVIGRGLANTDLNFRIDPEVISPMLKELVGPTKTRARVFDIEGTLISDSRQLYPRGPDAAGASTPDADTDIFTDIWDYMRNASWARDLPIYRELGPDGKSYEEVRVALTGSPAPLIRVTEDGETVISIAMPIQRDKTILGALMLTTQGSDIDDTILGERLQIIAVAGLVVLVTAILSWLLAGTIAGPMRRLAIAAERVRKNTKNREQIPDFSYRPDEIGYLSRALGDMTNALYSRIDAIESFAADVSHELKNPLTSLRNAANLLPAVKREEDKLKLIEIINHDVRRLDRLITDISDASRLDAELVRETARPVNLANLLFTLCGMMRDGPNASGVDLQLSIEGCSTPESFAKTTKYMVNGHDSRLGQVIVNLIENAKSFSPKGGKIFVAARRPRRTNEIEIVVEDEGPGIRPENLERIFERFYTDRPASFGQNSGLGLNITRQIIEAHGGRIWAENREMRANGLTMPQDVRGKEADLTVLAPPEVKSEQFACGIAERCSAGARFIIRLPACSSA
jgi:two-component system sensor histidine kinase ChvG